MLISKEDIKLLRQGKPPQNADLLKGMTLGKDVWFDRFKSIYLENYIKEGGSKVKVFVGSEGSGKTHLLRLIEVEAKELNYCTVYFSMNDFEWRLSDIVKFYKDIAVKINREELLKGLCKLVAEKLGYNEDRYDCVSSILPMLIENEGHTHFRAKSELRKAAHAAFKDSDLSPAFGSLIYNLVNQRMADDKDQLLQICWRWFLGEKLTPAEKQNANLFDRLSKTNARVWLYSLIKMIKLSGYSGLVILIDDFEKITERDPITNRYRYTPNATKDTYELIRQLIDDNELLQNFLLILSGRPETIDNETRGFKSYEALWMRLQTGLVTNKQFNPLSDIIKMDEHLISAGNDDYYEKIVKNLQIIFQDNGIPRIYTPLPEIETISKLRRGIIETAFLTDIEGN